jgi:hypothetical protein
MAYKVNTTDEYVEMSDGFMSPTQIYNYINKIVGHSLEFYELEMAEVMEVLLDETQLPDSNYRFFGSVKARPIVSGRELPTDPKDIESPHIYRPLDPNIKDYPVPGEYVIVVTYDGMQYYTQKVNLLNAVSVNAVPGLSGFVPSIGEDLYINNPENLRIRQVEAKPGDIVFNGRYGQSINFSSVTQTAPTIKIRAGQLIDAQKFEIDEEELYLTHYQKPVAENINADGSSIWLTADPEITGSSVDLNIEFSNAEDHTNMSKVHEDKGAQDGGKQVIINSDRIIFNSKQNEILGYSALGIGWSTPWSFTVDADRRVNLNSPDVQIGRGSHEVSPDEGAWPGVITITPHEEIPGATEEKRPGFGKGGVSLGYSSKSGLLVKDKYEKKYDKDKWEYGSIIGDPALEPVVKGEQLVDTLNDIIKLLKRLTYSGGGPLSNLPGKKLKALEEIYIGLDQVQINLGVNFLSDFVKTI